MNICCSIWIKDKDADLFRCLNFVKCHALEVCSADEFLGLDQRTLMQIAKHNDFNVDETVLYNGLVARAQATLERYCASSVDSVAFVVLAMATTSPRRR